VLPQIRGCADNVRELPIEEDLALDVHSIFAYGTLKRGGCREHVWPFRPLRIEQGFVRGTLFDLGPYPALTEGMDWIRGEIWRIAHRHWVDTLAVLDAEEGYGLSGEPDLYTRRAVPWHAAPGSAAMGVAQVYLWADQRLPSGAKRIVPRSWREEDAPFAVWHNFVGGLSMPPRE
jgi:gamma-glutamylcyclotransferase (GGCT)/AIG2-like uncharacterized protein YtfP